LPDWFAAEILPEVFKSNFPKVHKRHPGKPVGFSRPDGGPYIRFAVAVMGEMGMHISSKTVARAIQDIRDGRARRKRGGLLPKNRHDFQMRNITQLQSEKFSNG